MDTDISNDKDKYWVYSMMTGMYLMGVLSGFVVLSFFAYSWGLWK